jgi:hypothetical protein
LCDYRRCEEMASVAFQPGNGTLSFWRAISLRN